MQNSIQTGSLWDISNDLLVFQCTEVLTLTSLSIICEGEGIQFKELWADISNKLSLSCESWRFQTISLLKGVFHLLWGDVVHELTGGWRTNPIEEDRGKTWRQLISASSSAMTFQDSRLTIIITCQRRNWNRFVPFLGSWGSWMHASITSCYKKALWN